jgi:hypothetical protein
VALLPEEIESASPDPWSGKADSLVYTDVASVQALLDRRGVGQAFSGLVDDDAREKMLIRATELAETHTRATFRGQPVELRQGLLLPAHGALDGLSRLITTDPDEIEKEPAVRDYLLGIALLCEDGASAEGFLPLSSESSAGAVRKESARTWSIEFQDDANTASLQANHPNAARYLSALVPRF